MPAIEAVRGEADEVPMITAADGLLAAAELVQRTADSAVTRPPRGDLMLFLAGELARDSLRAPGLAADLMRRVALDWPESPYAPKALLAVIALDPAGADAARSDLESLYGASPYVAVTQGITDSTYHTLEDSLGSYAVAWLAAVRSPARNRSTVRPGERRPARASPGDPEPRRRREPPPGARVAEP